MRTRSHWGWGWADKFPDAAARRSMGEMVRGVLGVAELRCDEPVPIDAVSLRPARAHVPEVLAAFASDAPRERITHTYGRAYRDLVRGFRGDFGLAPDFVARVQSEDDVGAVLDWATDAGAAVIPYGGGTSVVGGIEADGLGDRVVVSLDLRGMDRVLEVDTVSRAARIQAGATGPVLEQQLGAHGLSMRFYPQSFEHATLGGWIATRAGGHFATLWTHVDDLVESTRTVTPRGVMESRRLPASGAGPAPDRLVLGSEGTLGVITEAWVRVQERPRFRAGATVRFADFGDAVAAVRALAQSGLHPANCRLLDAREAALNFVVGDGSNVLVLGFESADHALDAWMARALELCADHRGVCPEGATHRQTSAPAGSWKQAFIEMPYLQNTMVSLGVIADTFETACTWDRFAAADEAIRSGVQDAMRRVCGGGVLTRRFTHVYPDGPAPYYTYVAPGRAGGELLQWAEIKAAASEAISASGATITHHHAVGRMHRPWYDQERPELFADALRAAKRALDPAGILNPGCLIDP